MNSNEDIDIKPLVLKYRSVRQVVSYNYRVSIKYHSIEYFVQEP